MTDVASVNDVRAFCVPCACVHACAAAAPSTHFMLLLDLRANALRSGLLCGGRSYGALHSFGLQVKFDASGDVLKLLFDCGQLLLTEL